MKKFIFILFCLSFITIPAYAQSRQEFADKLSSVFELSGDHTGMYQYSDWLKIGKDMRLGVSRAAQSGVFALPKGGQFNPEQEMSDDDINLALKGIDRIVLQSNTLVKYLGVVTQLNTNGVTIKTDDGVWYNCYYSTPFLDKELKQVSDCSGLQVGDFVCIAIDKSGTVKFAWSQKENADNINIDNYELIGIMRGSLYLFDDPRFMFIMTQPEQYKFGTWKAISTKYDDKIIHGKAKVIMAGKEVDRNSINVNWLDKKVNYIVGKNSADGGKLKILHVQFE